MIDWRETLQTLKLQFESRASNHSGLNHLMVECTNEDKDKLLGPNWFDLSKHPPIIDGQPSFSPWDCSNSSGLPSVHAGFREPREDEELNDPSLVIRDLSGIPRAVSTPMKFRRSYLCGQSSENASAFKSLANVAATALSGADDLSGHVFASDLVNLFRSPRGGVRHIFGDVPDPPKEFMSTGWKGAYQPYENGVVIDVPIAESDPNSEHWLLLLHRLAWRSIKGSGLKASRFAWEGNFEVAIDDSIRNWSDYLDSFSANFPRISRDSFYSVLGSKDAPLDVNLCSVFAIQLLLTELENKPTPAVDESKYLADYSKEEWKLSEVPIPRTITLDELSASTELPKMGIFVATEVEKTAVIKKMRPLKHKRSIFQIYLGNNTCYVGRLGITNVVLCMTAMGSIGRDSSALVVSEIVSSCKLTDAVMVGIAFGKDPAKQKIGNVLVSERVISYEPKRIGDSLQLRGSQPTAGPKLLNRFRNTTGWRFSSPNGIECGVQVGPILSGEKLVDDPEFKRELFDAFPTAIGGEMEGVGFSAACDREKVEWIVVKAICDWADGKKNKEHQEFAAASAVSLVEHVMNQPGAL